MTDLFKGLYIVSTPIGNLDDITIRALNTLKNSDFILCEDTRQTLKLLNFYNIKKKLIAYHKFNEKKSLSTIIRYLNEGKILSLVSDAGTPLISDPGNILINEERHSYTVFVYCFVDLIGTQSFTFLIHYAYFCSPILEPQCKLDSC